jgi:hypothetical protein
MKSRFPTPVQPNGWLEVKLPRFSRDRSMGAPSRLRFNVKTAELAEFCSSRQFRAGGGLRVSLRSRLRIGAPHCSLISFIVSLTCAKRYDGRARDGCSRRVLSSSYLNICAVFGRSRLAIPIIRNDGVRSSSNFLALSPMRVSWRHQVQRASAASGNAA